MILSGEQRRLRTTSETIVVEEEGEVGKNVVVQTFKRPAVWRGYWTFQELNRS